MREIFKWAILFGSCLGLIYVAQASRRAKTVSGAEIKARVAEIQTAVKAKMSELSDAQVKNISVRAERFERNLRIKPETAEKASITIETFTMQVRKASLKGADLVNHQRNVEAMGKLKEALNQDFSSSPLGIAQKALAGWTVKFLAKMSEQITTSSVTERSIVMGQLANAQQALTNQWAIWNIRGVTQSIRTTVEAQGETMIARIAQAGNLKRSKKGAKGCR